MYLPVQRYEQIKHEVVDMYEECEISTFPIDCFDIASKLYYILVPYSKLNDHQLRLAMEYSSEGFSVLRKVPETGMYRYYIFYNDYNSYERQRWTIFHEIGHIINGDYGITFENEHAGQEDAADKYAEDQLIPPGEYEAFVRMNEFSENAIRRFAERIDRDPGIVLGRLQNDQIVPFTNVALSKALKHKYNKVITS